MLVCMCVGVCGGGVVGILLDFAFILLGTERDVMKVASVSSNGARVYKQPGHRDHGDMNHSPKRTQRLEVSRRRQYGHVPRRSSHLRTICHIEHDNPLRAFPQFSYA